MVSETVLKKYAEFQGRARRKEYWFFALFNILIGIGLGVVDVALAAMVGFGFLSVLYILGVFIPGLAVSVRRLHDTGRSGWWLLVSFVPVIGFFVLLYFLLQEGEAGENQYGSNPKQSDVALA